MELINKVAESGIITLDLENYYPSNDIIEIDIKDFLFRGLILKEKEFREALKQQNWTAYQDKTVAIFCSSDAILPQWAVMLMTTYLLPYTKQIYFGNQQEVAYKIFLKNIEQIQVETFTDARVVIKGCGTKIVHSDAYMAITQKLQPVVKSLMFGEPCSTVPVYKRK